VKQQLKTRRGPNPRYVSKLKVTISITIQSKDMNMEILENLFEKKLLKSILEFTQEVDPFQFGLTLRYKSFFSKCYFGITELWLRSSTVTSFDLYNKNCLTLLFFKWSNLILLSINYSFTISVWMIFIFFFIFPTSSFIWMQICRV
jgi:hypothetical protein